MIRGDSPNSGRRKRLEAIPEGNLYGQKVGLSVVFMVSLFLITAFMRNPYNMVELNPEELPPIRDVSMEAPLWEIDRDAFIDPPDGTNPRWMRVGFLHAPDPHA